MFQLSTLNLHYILCVNFMFWLDVTTSLVNVVPLILINPAKRRTKTVNQLTTLRRLNEMTNFTPQIDVGTMIKWNSIRVTLVRKWIGYPTRYLIVSVTCKIYCSHISSAVVKRFHVQRNFKDRRYQRGDNSSVTIILLNWFDNQHR